MKYVFLVLLLAVSTANATADGPDLYKVHQVKPDDVLNLRAEHSAKAKIIYKIPYDARGIKNLADRWPKYDSDAPPSKETLADRTDLTQQEKETLIKGLSWCKVEYKKKQGWVLCKYLAE